MAEEEKKYVVYGMRAKCSEGSMENYISTDVGHGVVYQGNPLLNANDHTPQVNLTHFGDCHSKLIYEEAKKQADEKYAADADDGFFAKAGKFIAKNVTKAALTAKEYLGANKCELDTPLPWMFANGEHMIDGAPALTMESQCACRYGGVISIVPVEEEGTAEAEDENVELEQVDAKVAEYEDMLYQQYGELIDQYQNIGELSSGKQTYVLNELKKINILDVLQDMGEDINSMPEIQNHKNNFMEFIDLVNTDQPLDLKNRKYVTPTGQEYSSLWSVPWGNGKGESISSDYAGNWLYGYVGCEFFTTFDDEDLLKYGAGAAQLWSDMRTKEEGTSTEDVIKEYVDSVLSGNYGDNINEGEKNDPEMIQEGIDAYQEVHKGK